MKRPDKKAGSTIFALISLLVSFAYSALNWDRAPTTVGLDEARHMKAKCRTSRTKVLRLVTRTTPSSADGILHAVATREIIVRTHAHSVSAMLDRRSSVADGNKSTRRCTMCSGGVCHWDDGPESIIIELAGWVFWIVAEREREREREEREREREGERERDR